MKKKKEKEDKNEKKFVYKHLSKKGKKATIVLNTGGKVRSVWRKK